jgi:methyl-accepting chemotaxis protein
MNLFKSLKFQFVVLFTVFIIGLVFITSILGLNQLATAVESVYAEKGLDIILKAQALIDGDAFEALARSQDINDPFYEETRLKLLDLRVASGSLYLYTMAPLGGDLSNPYWMFIIDGSVEPGHEDFSDMGDIEDASAYYQAFWDTIRTGQLGYSALAYQEGWGWLISAYAPIKNSRGVVVGIVGIDYCGAPLRATILNARRDKVKVAVIASLIGLLFTLTILWFIFSRLHKINTILKEISMGDGDITKRIKFEKNDEIGELSNYFNLTLDKIRNLIIVIKDESESLHNIGTELTNNMHKTKGSMGQITDNIETVQQKVITQTDSVLQTNTNMKKITHAISNLGSNIEAQTANVSESSFAIEELLKNVQNVTQALIKNAESVGELIKVSDESRESLQKVTSDIQEIAKESEGLLEINAVIENIARQTNLLGLNAAVEAARAGDAGVGFAVVAGEVRNLAENSSEQSQIISNALTKMKNGIDKIILSTDTVLEKFTIIDERVQTVAKQEAGIRESMEKQGEGSHRILEVMRRLTDQTQMVKTGSDDMMSGSKEVIRVSENLESATVEISAGVNNMTSRAHEVNNAVIHINSIATKTSEHINTLNKEISKFKV